MDGERDPEDRGVRACHGKLLNDRRARLRPSRTMKSPQRKKGDPEDRGVRAAFLRPE
jgi:hypothetical protein